MTTFDMVIMLGGACGILMVIGGMLLLYTGAISLNKTAKEEAVMLEFKKMLRITTHYPALGLFIIGLAFIISAAAFSTPKQPQFKITGKLAMQIDDPSSLIVTIAPPSWQQGRAYDSGDIMALVTPTTEILDVTLSAPGYRQLTFEVQTNQSKFGTLSIGDVTLTKVVDKPMLNTDNIVPAPTGLPSLDKQGAF